MTTLRSVCKSIQCYYNKESEGVLEFHRSGDTPTAVVSDD